MDQPATTTTETAPTGSTTQSSGSSSSSTTPSGSGARVQLKRHIGGLGFEEQEAQLRPAATAPDAAPVQLMRRDGQTEPPVQQQAAAPGMRVQRRAVQRTGPPPPGGTPAAANTTTPPGNTTAPPGNTTAPPGSTPTPAEETMTPAQITAWRQEFEIKIGTSLVGGAEATANTALAKVIEYMEQRHGSLDPAAKGYRDSVKAIGNALGKPDLDNSTVWGGAVRPEDFEQLITEMRAKGTRAQSFGLREKLFAVQMWFENVLSADLIESHTKVQEYAQQAGMVLPKINQFWANARQKFAEANAGAPESGMNAWNNVAGMYDDPRVAEQGRTRDRSGVSGTDGRSQMTVAKFRELGGVLSSYELQKLIRLEGKEAEFQALVDGGMNPEAALQEMIKRGLDQAVLPWNEGARAFKPKVDALVAAEAQGMPGMAGTSGTTARMVTTGGMLGVPAGDMLKAMLAMLLPIRAHSFMEIVRGSGVPHSFNGTVEDYQSVVPGCRSQDPEGFDKAKRSEGGGGGGSAGGGGGTG